MPGYELGVMDRVPLPEQTRPEGKPVIRFGR